MSRSPPAHPTFPGGPGPTALTSSLCVDGHFFRRRPQLSRFPVCRCRVLARARSAPAARLSVPMAAAALTGGPASDGAAEGRAGRRLPPQGAVSPPGPRGEREAAGLRAATARCALGPEEAGAATGRRSRRGGAGADGRTGGRAAAAVSAASTLERPPGVEGAVSWKTMTKQKPTRRKCFVTVTRPAAGQGRGAEGPAGAQARG